MSSSLSFETIEEAIASPFKPFLLHCRINGEILEITEATTRHSVDSRVGTCSVVASLPTSIDITLNTSIEIMAGYPGVVHRIFHGIIPNHSKSISSDGRTITIRGTGWSSYLDYPSREDIQISGPIALKEAFRSLCEMRNVPTYQADDTTYVDGVTTIMVGGNDDIHNGDVVIEADRTPLAWINSISNVLGYRAFDSPDGSFRLARVSGRPPESVVTFTEGYNCYSIEEIADKTTIGTYFEIFGARYTASDGGTLEIRSIPSEVPYSQFVDPPGYVHVTISSEELVTNELAEGARNAHEVDYSLPSYVYAWECAGNPYLQPGDVVMLYAPTFGMTAPTPLWLMDISHRVGSDGFISRMAGWSGGGSPLTAGNDCISFSVGSGVYHLGNQYISYYARPSHQGEEEDIAITIPDDEYSSLRITGYAHGTNSYGAGRENQATKGSKIEVWQLDDPTQPESGTNEFRSQGSVEFPILAEESNRRRPYATSNKYWNQFSLPMPGGLKAGAATLKLIAGENPDGRDDYEVKNMTMVMCGVGEPVLPGAGE